MSAPAFLQSDFTSPVGALDRVRDVVINWMEQVGIVAADAEERGDTEAFDAAMRSFASYRRVVDLIAIEIQREQRVRQ